jgi:putative endonuclease
VFEHRNKLTPGFTSKYCIGKLLFFEYCLDPIAAIEREKQIKKYSRKKKLALIQKINQNLNDLYDQRAIE